MTGDHVKRWWARHHVHLSTMLGLLLLAFYIDGFIRGDNAQSLFALVLAGVFLVLGLRAVASDAVARRPQLAAVLLCLLGTLAVGELHRWHSVSPVLAAAIVGVVAGVVPRITHRVSDADVAPIYAGAFVGMTDVLVLSGPGWLIVSGVVSGLIWSTVREAWMGVGGKMGTVAFAGVGATVVLSTVLGGTQRAPIPIDMPPTLTVLVLVAIAGALLTHWLAFRWRWGITLASGAVTVAAAAVSMWVAPALSITESPFIATLFGATFVAMTSPSRLPARWMLPLMAALFAALISLFEPNLAGLGGDLGATAATAVLAVIGLQWAISRRPSRNLDT